VKEGDSIYAPPGGRRWASRAEWVPAALEAVGRPQLVRDPTPDRDHRTYQWVTVRYDDGTTAKFEFDLLEGNQ
jgi:hypothetical protein